MKIQWVGKNKRSKIVQKYLNKLMSDTTTPPHTQYDKLAEIYNSLLSIAEEYPEQIPQVLDTYKVALASEKNDSFSLETAYKSLAPIARVAQPEQIPQVLEAYKVALANKENDRDSLLEAYWSLDIIAKSHPEQIPQVLEAYIRLASKSYSWELHSWELLLTVHESLASIAEAHPEQIQQIIIALTTSENANSLRVAYHFLSTIAETHPEQISQILEAYKVALANKENDKESLQNAYVYLASIAKIAQSEQISQVLDIYKIALASENNFRNSLKIAYGSLASIAKAHPEQISQVLEVYKVALASEENDYYSLIVADLELISIAKIAQSEQIPQVLELFKTALASKKNDANSLETVHESLASIAEAHPEQIQQIIIALTTSENANSLRVAYHFLSTIAETHPEQISQILEIFKTSLASEKNNEYSLRTAYESLASIAETHPKQISQILEIFKTALNSEKNDTYSLEKVYESLASIDEEYPEQISQVLELFKTALKSEKNNFYSLKTAYKSLASIAKVAHPEQIPQVLEVLKTALASEKNEEDSLETAYESLASIAEAHPEYLPQILEIYKVALASEKNDEVSLKEAYSCLAEIAQKEPAYALEVLKIISPQEKNLRLKVYYAYLQKNRLTPNEVPEHDQTIFQAALKIRRSMPAEAEYFIENMTAKQIVEYNISAQQRAMNVLLGLAAKEQGISAEESAQFRKQPSEKVQSFFESEKDWLLPTSMKSAEIFGCWLPNYLKKTEKHFSVHDAIYWLPENLGTEKRESFSLFLRNNIVYTDNQAQEKARPLSELSVIAHNWKGLKPEEEKQSYKDVLAICQSKKYENQKYDNFAVEAAKFGYSEDDYPTMEKIYDAGLDVPEPFDSTKEFKLGKYTGKFLPREDSRAGFFGNYTDCCQHFGGVGHTCAVSSVKDPYSQLFVIENEEGRIIAGSWVWENTEGKYRDVCFDNIEAIGEYSENPLINKIYEQVGSYLCQEANCRRVTIGTGYQDADVSKYPKTEKISLPSHYGKAYSDAKGTQLLLAENKNAEPLDKTQESLRFTRNVCPLDYEEMDKVSEKCFPEGDQALQAPENLSGKVLVDEYKGVVGYCLYDEEDKHIYDMAVLPEYRKDKNASSKRLIGAVMKEIRALGGEWSLEARDKTSLRLLEAMEQRGMVKLEKGDVDHVMSDGSKVFECRFKILPKAENQMQMTRDNGHDDR